jgi:penicillin-binding protein 1C
VLACVALAGGGVLALDRALAPAVVPSYAEVVARQRPSEALLLDRRGEVLDVQRRDFGVRRLAWVHVADVSPALLAAVVQGEDRRFASHRGVDWLAVAGALRDRALGRARRGASTITMQVATLLEPPAMRRAPSPWQRKLRQVRVARGLERTWTKTQILEAYLNLLHFRGELQGLGAASQALAAKSPAGLTRAESLVLAALLPSPTAAPDAVAARACARRAAEESVKCDELRSVARQLLARGARRDPPTRLAPHLARALLKEPGTTVRTTLDARVQRLAVAALDRQLGDLQSRNVRDGAVLVIDNASGEVLAYVGSGGPASRAREVDGVRAPRQAGSTLKPFLYELAIERRYLTAASLLDDSPVNLDTATGAYIPQNYDRQSKGLVSVRTSLASSLNVPAVRTLVLVGVEPFRARLHELGYEGLTEGGEFYGYSLALGSAEVTLWQQAEAYRTLARGGVWSPLRVVADAAARPAAQRRVLPEDAAFVVTDVLADRAARVATFGLDNHLNTPFWTAVKTGTSKDMRDNWCVGFSATYAVAVWIGNFEGDAMHDVTGVTGAAPVWRELMTALHEDVPSEPPSPPAGVYARDVRFAPAVEAPRREWFVGADAAERRARAAGAAGAGTTSGATAAAPSVRRRAGPPGSGRTSLSYAEVVATPGAAGAIARISSPANGVILALDPDIPAELQRVPLAAEGAAAAMRLSLNGRVVGPASSAVLWQPRAGAHVLALEDERGRTVDRVLFTVR